MDRKAREQKAALVRQAIKAMTEELKVAKGQRKADLFHDMGLAYQDLETFEDDTLWGDDGELLGDITVEEDVIDAPVLDAPVIEEPAPEFMDGPECPQDMFHKTEDPGVPASPLDEPEFCTDVAIEMMAGEGKKEESEPNDNTKAPGGEVPMGAMAEHSNVYAWEDVNRQHISYLLDKVADITSAIEQYEHRAAVANKKAKSEGARKRISATMKELAQVVSASDLTTEETGKHLDAVGVKVMEMHKGMGLSA